MFDLGWMELLIIGVTALIVVGPKDLPKLFKKIGIFVGKARKLAREFQYNMEAAADESGLKDASETLNSIGEIRNPQKFGKKAFSNLVSEKEEIPLKSDSDNHKKSKKNNTEKKMNKKEISS